MLKNKRIYYIQYKRGFNNVGEMNEWMNWWIKEALLKEYIYILMQVFLT